MRQEFLWYLATPYTKHVHGMESAAYDAGRLTAKLLKAGFNVFSPIVHSHTVGRIGGMKLEDGELWKQIDRVFVQKSDGLLVALMPGWDVSAGVAHEITEFQRVGKPAYFVNPDSLLLSLWPDAVVLPLALRVGETRRHAPAA